MVAQVAWDPGRGIGLPNVKPLGRVTIQFYKATDNDAIFADDVAQITARLPASTERPTPWAAWRSSQRRAA